MQQAGRRHQKNVVCKMAAREYGREEVLQSPRSARKLSCCLQDSPRRLRPAKPVRRYVLGPKLRCCLQAGKAAASGRGPSAAPGFVASRLGAPPGIASSSRDGRRATCANCPGKPGGWRYTGSEAIFSLWYSGHDRQGLFRQPDQTMNYQIKPEYVHSKAVDCGDLQ